MKSIKLFFLWAILFIFSACCENEEFNSVIDNCDALENAEILSEQDKQSTCIYNNVYRYKSEIYLVCECCVCDKIYMAVDCNGNNLCDFNETCMNDFNENAEYLFAVKSE